MALRGTGFNLIPKRKLAPYERISEQFFTHIREIQEAGCPVRCYRVEAWGRLRIPVGNNMYDTT